MGQVQFTVLGRAVALRRFCGALAACTTLCSVSVNAATISVAAGTTAAQLNTSIQNADAGTVFEFAADTVYAFDQTIDLESGITLRGAGPDSVIRATGSQEAIVRALGPSGGLSNLAVENLTLDGGGADGNRNTYGFQAWGQSGTITGVRLSGLTIRNIGNNSLPDSSQFGVFFTDNVTDSVIENSIIEDINPDSVWAAGIRVANGSSRNVIAGNHVARTGRGGILTNDNSTDLLILNNTVSKSGLADGSQDDLGIELFNGNDNSVVQGNTVDSWVSVDSSDRVAVRGNTVTGDPDRDNAFFGLEIVDSSDVVFADNEVRGGVDIGLSFSGSGVTQNVLVVDNEIKNAGTFGVQLQGEAGGAREIYLARNLFDGTTSADPGVGDGVRLNENLTDIVFDRNTITNNSRNGIAVNGDAATYDHIDLIGNVLSNNASGDFDGIDILNLLDPADFPAADFLEAEAGETLTFTFDGITGQPVRVLWDLGVGAPIVTVGPSSSSVGVILPDSLAIGTVVSAVAWNADGDADFRSAVVIPEPSLGAMVLIGGFLMGGVRGVRRRPIHASTES
ncbi:MAG: right-handed parallel beta-helix repeat-containing protein [Planctomycetota bacterium]